MIIDRQRLHDQASRYDVSTPRCTTSYATAWQRECAHDTLSLVKTRPTLLGDTTTTPRQFDLL
jgi:hypothetical protein